MSSSSKCYWPNGKAAGGNYPCSDDKITSCCGSNSICLSNGYCMDITQPFAISRGACTSDTWASGCPTECQQTEFEDKGSTIVNLNYNSTTDVSTYCCGTAVGTGSGTETDCQYGYDSFTLDDGSILAGYNALANYTETTTSSSNSTSCSNSSSVASNSSSGASNSSHDVALGVGLGVPLGVIALGSLLWAFWERKRANQLSKALAASSIPGQGFASTPQDPQARLMSEQSRLTELDSTWRPQELPGK